MRSATCSGSRWARRARSTERAHACRIWRVRLGVLLGVLLVGATSGPLLCAFIGATDAIGTTYAQGELMASAARTNFVCSWRSRQRSKPQMRACTTVIPVAVVLSGDFIRPALAERELGPSSFARAVRTG